MKKLKGKKIKKIVIPALIVGGLFFTIGTTIYAKTQTFSYEMGVAVYGKTQYYLQNKNTNVYTTADTRHRERNQIWPSKLNYRVSMGKHSRTAKADGRQYTLTCGTVKAGNYKVNLQVTSYNEGYARYVKGTGRIVQ